MELDYNQPKTECPKYQCKGDKCKCGLSYVVIPAVLGDDSEGSEVAPKNGAYCNTMVKYAANNNIYLYSSEGVPVLVDENLWPTLEEMQEDIDTLEEGLADEIEARTSADQAIEEEIEHLRNNPDVVDIVATYADLVAYDTSELGDKDVIRVLTDETHDDESTYYRWNKPNQEWVFIGAVEGYYTKDQTDALLEEKQDVLTAGDNISIVDDTISAVDTTYTAGNGLSLNDTEFSVDTSVIQEKLTAGSNISIDANNEISAVDTTYTAGTNITIDANNQISATDTTYTAGNGLDLTGTEFSVDSTVVALQSDLPTNTSDLTNDGADGTSTYVEADELATVATTGDYGDLLNTPTIPTVNDATLTIQKNSTDVGTFTANASSNSTINITVPTTAADVSALPDSTKYGASISLTIDSSTYVVTAQLKDQDNNNLGSAQTIDLPLESVVVNGSYDSQTKEVVLTLQGGSTIRFSVADLVSGLQSEITSQSPLDADLVDDSTSTNKFVTSTDITTWNGKQNALTAGSNISISGDTISATDTTYSNFTGATSQDAGAAGLVPAPAAGDEGKFLSGNGLWTTVSQYSLPIASANDLGGIKVGTNLSIDANTGVLSATDTTYSNFTGTDGTTAGAAGLVPAPATTDVGKFLKADGTWDTAGGSGPTVVQTTGTSTTDVMSQNATTSLVYADPATRTKIKIGDGAYANEGEDGVEIGHNSKAGGVYAVGIGSSAEAKGSYSVALGYGAESVANGVSLGRGARAQATSAVAFQRSYTTTQGQVQFELVNAASTEGYNNSKYRLLSGVYDGQSAHDAATKGQLDSIAIKNAGAPTTATVGTVGQLLEDTTNGKLYICTDATNPYVWEEVGTGGGGGDAISAADWTALWADTIQNMNGVGV